MGKQRKTITIFDIAGVQIGTKVSTYFMEAEFKLFSILQGKKQK